MQKLLFYIIILAFLGSSCKKSLVRHIYTPQPIGPSPATSILVDASRDGGAWWAPQAGPFDATQPHQGSALSQYLKQLGYSVKELGRGTTITKDLLLQYRYVIRAVGDGVYSPDELEAYRSYVTKHNALLLFNDQRQNYPNDNISSLLGLQFEGSYSGKITSFNLHQITSGVSSLDYIDGSVILKPDPLNVTSLAYFSNGTVTNATAMGILNGWTSRIVFAGDLSGIELLPQPLTDNLFRWWLQ